MCTAIVTGGCDIINPEDPIPAYLYIEDIEFTVKPGQGTASERISEAWFYANDEFLGAYSLPALIPVLAEGATEVIIFPGVRVNGISMSPDIYPFYTRYTVTVDLQAPQTDTIYPQTEYIDQVQFAFIEDFEVTNIFADDRDGDPVTRIEPSGAMAFEGNRSGRIVLSAEHPTLEVAQLPLLDNLPQDGSRVFLELNYLNSTELGVGLVGHEPGLPVTSNIAVVLRIREDWNKIYIELTDALRASQLSAYQVLFTAFHDPGNDTSEIFLDNIKLVHMQS